MQCLCALWVDLWVGLLLSCYLYLFAIFCTQCYFDQHQPCQNGNMSRPVMWSASGYWLWHIFVMWDYVGLWFPESHMRLNPAFWLASKAWICGMRISNPNPLCSPPHMCGGGGGGSWSLTQLCLGKGGVHRWMSHQLIVGLSENFGGSVTMVSWYLLLEPSASLCSLVPNSTSF